MAINNVKDTQSLLHDIEDWMDNPKFQPKEQNKWFFGEGLSYYTQLCEVVKVLTYLQENFKIVIANEKSLEQAYNEVKDLPNQVNALSTKVDDLTNTVSDLPTRVQELETKVTKLISDVSSQLTRIETLERDVVSINAKDISQDSEIASIKSKNQEQDTLIDSNTNKITTLEGKDFLTNVRLENSDSITFQGGEKVDGVQTYIGQVIGSVPVNLGENVAFASNANIELISAIANPILTETTSNSFIRKKQYNRVKDGKLSTNTFIVDNFVNEFFKLTRNDEITLNIDNVLSGALLLNGSNNLPTYTPILNNINTGIACSYNTQNLPVPNTETIILCGSIKNNIHIQVAFTSEKIFFRISSDGVNWANWVEYYTNKQDKLTFTETDFNVTNNNVSLNPTKFTNYLLKSDAPGYADILTNANASSTYVSKTEAVGYDDILTNSNASTTYETKANASSTYVSKTDAVGYDDILTNANATATYPTKTEMTNAINSAIGTAINATY